MDSASAAVSYTPVESPEPNPHGPVTFGKLTSMKIRDRSSVYVSGIKKCNASRPILSKYENFGQFGPISSLRVIQKTNPAEVYLRYVRAGSAAAAISWCRNRGLEADHGYHKYCIKFINNKTCKRLNCPNRHSWCYEAEDIMTKYKLPMERERERANETKMSAISNKPQCSQWQKSPRHLSFEQLSSCNPMGSVPPSSAPEIALNFPMSSSPQSQLEVDPFLKTLQTQFLRLQQQYTAQNEFIKNLMTSYRRLKDENQRLRRQRPVRVHPVEVMLPTQPMTPSPATPMDSYSGYQPTTPSSMEMSSASLLSSHSMELSANPNQKAAAFYPQHSGMGGGVDLNLETNQSTKCPVPIPLKQEQLSCGQIVDALILEDVSRITI